MNTVQICIYKKAINSKNEQRAISDESFWFQSFDKTWLFSMEYSVREGGGERERGLRKRGCFQWSIVLERREGREREGGRERED